MRNIWKTGLVLGALVLAPAAMAEEAAVPAAEPAATDAAAPAAPAVVDVHLTGEQAVTVNTGSENVDAVANYAAKCAERATAMKACDQMGGFKAMGCRKLAAVKYKAAADCPNL